MNSKYTPVSVSDDYIINLIENHIKDNELNCANSALNLAWPATVVDTELSEMFSEMKLSEETHTWKQSKSSSKKTNGLRYDVLSFDFPDELVNIADDIFIDVYSKLFIPTIKRNVNGDTTRRVSGKAAFCSKIYKKCIIYGCVFIAFKMYSSSMKNTMKSSVAVLFKTALLDKKIDTVFDLPTNKKTFGINKILEISPELMSYVLDATSVKSLVLGTAMKMNSSLTSMISIDKYCDSLSQIIEDLSLNSQPISVAIGILYRYILNNRIPISVGDLSNISDVAIGTIKRLEKKIASRINEIGLKNV
jgi:hypothetical protein